MWSKLLAAGPPTAISPLPNISTDSGRIQTILSVVFALFAVSALIAIVIAGLRYTTSGGDPQSMAKAKSIVMYSSIGLIISISAFSIVTFLLNNI